MKGPSIDTSGTEAAQRAVAQAQTAANNLQKNFASDLKTENMATITPGGSADAVSSATTYTPRRKSSSGLSSQLGINV